MTWEIQKIPLLSGKNLTQFVLLTFLGVFLTICFGVWWFIPGHIPHNFQGNWHLVDFILFAALSYVVWHQIVNELFGWYLAAFMKKTVSIAPQKGKRVAFLTAFVPGKEPYDVLERTLRAMTTCHYPHDTWLLDEGNDAIAKKICAQYGVKHFTRKNAPHYNLEHGPYKAKTKGGNYNSWYNEYAKHYDFVAQLDVDFIPKKDFLTKTLGYFRDPKVAFVGTPQIYGNQHSSWIARGAAEQAYNFYGCIQRGLFGQDMFLFIGANHIVRVSAHTNIGGYSGHIVEDHLTGMRFYANKWKSVYVAEVLATGEGPSTWGGYFSQQMRWAYGLIHILLTESPKLFRKMNLKHALNYFFLQQYYFDGIAQALGILLIGLFFLFGIQSTNMGLISLLTLYAPVLIIQQVIFIWLQRFYIDPKSESGSLWRGKLLSLAAWPIYLLAFIQVVLGKKLTYAVTPKGAAQEAQADVGLFLPHAFLGSATLITVITALVKHIYAPHLLFFATLNTVVMIGFFVSELVLVGKEKLRDAGNAKAISSSQ